MADNTSRGNLARPGDIWLALGLLTRLPILNADMSRGAAAAWAWPLAGAVVGVFGALTLWLADGLGLSAGVAAALTLTVMIITTGALHEDGLADSADGLWGGWSIERRLEIMRDSRIGTYGALALCLSSLARWSLIVAIAIDGGAALLIAAAMLSRAPMVAVMAVFPPARMDGLARSVGRPTRQTAGLAGGVAVVGAVIFAGFAAILAALMAYGAAAALAWIARRRIGGQTGDTLGASQQLAEIAALAALVSVLR